MSHRGCQLNGKISEVKGKMVRGCRFRLLVLLSFVLFPALPLPPFRSRAIAAEILEVSQPAIASLEGKEIHSYSIPLVSGQYARLSVIQQGIDAIVRVLTPEGKLLLKVDDEGDRATEEVVFIAATAGNYRVQILPFDNSASPGRYTVQLEELRAATEDDRQRFAAELAFLEGRRLEQQRTAVSLRQAIDKFQQGLPIWRATGKRTREALALQELGLIHLLLGEATSALEYYNLALPILRDLGDRAAEAQTLSSIGILHRRLGDMQRALDYYDRALNLHREIGNRAGEATTLNNIAVVRIIMGETQEALEYSTRALALHRAAGNRAEIANTLSNIGGIYAERGEPQKALEYYHQALSMRRELGKPAGIATTLHNIGATYDDLGEKQQALEYYNQALPLRREAGDRPGEARTLHNIGAVYDDLGEKQQALDYYNRALPLRRELGDRLGEAVTLNNIGKLYDDLGEKQQALDYYNQALPLRRAASDRPGEARTLNNIGDIYSDLGDRQKGLEYYRQALAMFQQTENRRGEASVLNNLGATYAELQDERQALNYYNQALPLRRAVGDRLGEARTLNNLGVIYQTIGNEQEALQHYQSALTLFRVVRERAGEATSLFNLARLKRDRNQLSEALKDIEATIAIVEDLRTKIASSDLRSSYFATVQDYYELYIDLLMQLHQQEPDRGYDARAIHASERAKARSLLELLTEANADIRQGVDPKLLEKEWNLQEQLDLLERQRIEILSRNPTAERVAQIEQQRESRLSQYRDIQAQIRATSPKYAAIAQPQPLTLAQIQQQILDEDTLLLQYSLGNKRSYLWLVGKNSIDSYQLPPRKEIEAAARQFYRLLNDPGFNLADTRGLVRVAPRSTSQTIPPLSQMLLGQVADRLGNKRLLIVSDGALQYIPFAALPTPETEGSENPIPLVRDREIVNLPSVSTLGILRRELQGRAIAPKQLAILADPVFSHTDRRVRGNTTRSSPESNLNRQVLERSTRDAEIGLQPLPGTRKEAEAIQRFVPDSQRTQALDFAANREFVTNPNLAQYQIIHFATHGILNSKNPELSGIVLSLFNEQGNPQNGFLRLHDVFNLDLPAELVVLSACQTGLGQEVKGEGLVGLTRGFMYAGAPRVLVSLWNVDDAATAEMMVRFYRLLLQEKLTAPAALRQAQLEMQTQTKWKNPYYWAAFALQGEWL